LASVGRTPERSEGVIGLSRAAGGVVWRPVPGGVEVCVIHRPRYDDWSLPKGKLTAREHRLAAAVREVAEETGVRAQPQVRLPSVRYRRDGAPKVVDYWSMRALSVPRFRANSEVDRLRWLPPEVAAHTVTYEHDARVLRHFATLPAVTAVLVLLRHGQAGKRGAWPGPDAARPLDPTGRAQARDLAALLAPIAPERLVSASALRCTQTLDPLAARLDLAVEVDRAFNEPAPGRDPDTVAARATGHLVALAAAGTSAVVCSQGKVIPPLLARLAGLGSPRAWATPKGGGWLLAFAGTHLAGADRLTV
jgi:8-oxo-(d)GTP phosphatase